MSQTDRDETSGRQRTALFVERGAYRHRRLMDLARLLPLTGALLFCVPLMWPNPDPYPAPDTSGGMAMSEAITYMFVVWTLLILASLAFGGAVRRWAENWSDGTDQPGEEAP
ncbi:MAG: hypothetical protein HRU33_06080 [Rhodobacteraceae bacterium]|nr:hypothetical protein [Paracoccaceae bacterium]